MSRIKIEKELTLTGTPETVKINPTGAHKSVGTNAYIQVNSGSVTLTGTMDSNEDSYAVGAIKMSDFSGVSSLSTTGIYLVPIDGLETLTLSGTAEVILRVIED